MARLPIVYLLNPARLSDKFGLAILSGGQPDNCVGSQICVPKLT